MTKVAFVTSHPIQYQVPVFRELTRRGNVDLTVLYAQIPDGATQGSGFGVAFTWDLPLLDGYRYHLLQNVSKRPSLVESNGCDTPGIGDYIREQQFEAVIVNGWGMKTCRQALNACLRRKIPCLVRGEANHLRPRAWWKRLLQRFLARKYSGYLYIGESNKAFYKSYGVPDHLLFPCRYCIENERFGAVAENAALRATARARWGVTPDEVCFLFSGKFEEKKHPVELVQAFGAAVNQGLRARLLMVGDGALKPQCETLIQQNNWPITLTGFINQGQIPEAYLASDCLVLPSDSGETWGLVVNEAMACGRPAIVSSLVGCREDLVEEETTGWSFRFGDWEQLQQLLWRAAQDPAHLHRMGLTARERIQKYSPLAAAEGIEQSLRSLASPRRQRSG